MLEEEKTKNTIWCDRFDHEAFQRMLTKAENFGKVIQNYEKTLKTIDGLAQDIFNSLYKFVVRDNPDEAIEPQYLYNRPFIKKGMKTKEYEELRCYTRLQEIESTLATMTILSVLMQEIAKDGELWRYVEKINEANDIQTEINKLFSRLQGLEVAEQSATDTTVKDQLKKEIQSIQNKIQKLKNKMPEIQQPSESKLRQAMSKAIKTATEEEELFNSMVTGWGMEQGTPQQLQSEIKFEIAKQLIKNQKIRALSKILGRFKRLAISKWKNKIKKEPSEIYDITQGNDLAYLLPSELLKLSMPEIEILFYKEYIERKLLQYDLEAKERMGKGAIVCCVDNSGSMEGDREIWSKAVALAILEIALKEQREYAVIHFGSSSDPIKIIEIHPKDDLQTKMKNIMEIATYFLGGGTDFEKPLRAALTTLTKNEYKKGDIVFITDGECEISKDFEKEFLKVKKDKEFKMITVNIGGSVETLEHISDKTIKVANLVRDSDEVAGEVFEFF